MRIIVMYDLPVADMQDRREYSRFRQFLVRDGYTRLQNSVYTRLGSGHQERRRRDRET